MRPINKLAAIALAAGLLSPSFVQGTAEAAPPALDTGSIKLAWDGTGHGTSSQTFVTTANGFAIGDNSPTDGVVATNDTVGYNVALRFAAGPARNVQVTLDTGAFTLVPDAPNTMCKAGVGFTATGRDNSCVYSIQSGVVASVDATVPLLAPDASVNQKVSPKLSIANVAQELPKPVTVVAAPAMDFVLGASSNLNSTDGVATASVMVNKVFYPGSSSTKGYFKPAKFNATFVGDTIPDGTTIRFQGVTRTFAAGRASFDGVAFDDNGAMTAVLNFPSGSYPTSPDQPDTLYKLGIVVDPASIANGDIQNLGTGQQPGNGQSSSYTTNDPARNILPGVHYPNNDYANIRFYAEEEKGLILDKNNLAPSDSTQSIFGEGNRVYKDWSTTGTRSLQPVSDGTPFPRNFQVAAKTQFESDISINSKALPVGQSPQLTVCDTWEPLQSFDPTRTVVVLDGSGNVVPNSIYTVEFSTGGCSGSANWTSGSGASTNAVRVAIPAGVVAQDSGKWTVRLPMKSPDVVNPAQHLVMVRDDAVLTSSTHVLQGDDTFTRHIQLVTPQPAMLSSTHFSDSSTVGMGNRVEFFSTPTISNVFERPGSVTQSVTVEVDPCLTDIAVVDQSQWNATITRGTATCDNPSGTKTTIKATRTTSSPSYDPSTQKVAIPNLHYTAVPSLLTRNGATFVNTSTWTTSLTGDVSSVVGVSVKYVSPEITSQKIEALTPLVEVNAPLLWRAQMYVATPTTESVSNTVILPRRGDSAVTMQLGSASLSEYISSGEPLGSSFNGTVVLKSAAIDWDNTPQGTVLMATTSTTVGTGSAVTWVPLADVADISKVTGLRAVVPASASGPRTATINITLQPTGNAKNDVYLMHTDPVLIGTMVGAPKTFPVKERVVSSAITGTVWWDNNRDSFLDETGTGIPSVQVDLLDSTGKVVRTTYTDYASGSYSFDNLPAGTYTTRVTRTPEMTTTTSAYGQQIPVEQTYSWDGFRFSNAKTTSSAIVLPMDKVVNQVDFGFFKPNPRLDIDKSEATVRDDGAGTSLVTWTVQVRNDGNVPITNPVFSDRMPNGAFNVQINSKVDAPGVSPKYLEAVACDSGTFERSRLGVAPTGIGFWNADNTTSFYPAPDGVTFTGVTNPEVKVPSCGQLAFLASDGKAYVPLFSDGGQWKTSSNSVVGWKNVFGDATTVPDGKSIAKYFAVCPNRPGANGLERMYVLDSDGNLWGKGLNTSGSLGVGSYQSEYTDYTRVNFAGGLKVKRPVGCGTSTQYFIMEDGSLWASGSGYNTTPSKVSAGLPAGAKVADFISGGSDFVILEDGSAMGMGGNYYGQLGVGSSQTTTSYFSKVLIPAGERVTRIDSTDYLTAFLTESGNVYFAGGGVQTSPAGYPEVAYSGGYGAVVDMNTPNYPYQGDYGLFTTSTGELLTWDPYQPDSVMPRQMSQPIVELSADGELALTQSGTIGAIPYFGSDLTMMPAPNVQVSPDGVATPVSTTSDGTYTTRTYSAQTLSPGATATYTVSANFRKSSAIQYVPNHAWTNSDQTPLVNPAINPVVTSSNYDPSGLLKPNGAREAGWDGDRVDGTPARIPANTQPVGSLSGYAWTDTNKNGIRDNGESYRAGERVTLTLVTTSGGTTTTSYYGETTTDATGQYRFTNLPVTTANSRYEVTFEAAGEKNGKFWSYTTPRVGADTTLNSKVDVASGKVTGITVAANTDSPWNNAGLVEVTAGIVVDKTINGADGLVLPIGASGTSAEAVATVRVTNPSTSSSPITGFALVDTTTEGPAIPSASWVWRTSGGQVIANPTTYVLNPGGYLTITGSLGNLRAGVHHANTARVSATAVSLGIPVASEDPSSVSTVDSTPSISVKKYLNDTSAGNATPTGVTADGQDSDANTAPVIDKDGTVTTKYVVTNTGNEPLYSVTLSGPMTNKVEHTFPSPLMPGQTVVFAGPDEKIPTPGTTYSSPVTVTAIVLDANGNPRSQVTDTDGALATIPAPEGDIRVTVWFSADGSECTAVSANCAPLDSIPVRVGAEALTTNASGTTLSQKYPGGTQQVAVTTPAWGRVVATRLDSEAPSTDTTLGVPVLPGQTRHVQVTITADPHYRPEVSPDSPWFESGI